MRKGNQGHFSVHAVQDAAEKNRISHRGRATEKLRKYLTEKISLHRVTFPVLKHDLPNISTCVVVAYGDNIVCAHTCRRMVGL